LNHFLGIANFLFRYRSILKPSTTDGRRYFVEFDWVSVPNVRPLFLSSESLTIPDSVTLTFAENAGFKQILRNVV